MKRFATVFRNEDDYIRAVKERESLVAGKTKCHLLTRTEILSMFIEQGGKLKDCAKISDFCTYFFPKIEGTGLCPCDVYDRKYILNKLRILIHEWEDKHGKGAKWRLRDEAE